MNQDFINALYGGLIIGAAVTLMLYLNGRVTGISGIIYGIFSESKKGSGWRYTFVLGLLSGGFLLRLVYPSAFQGALPISFVQTAVAGFLVGFGTILGSGCTSGHGVCGMSRLSMRSILATLTFIGAGIFTVFILRTFGGVL